MNEQVALDRIAVVGMSARLPGASDVEEFWELLTEGREGLSRLAREDLLAAGVPAEVVDREGYVPVKGLLAEADCFDAGFFGYSPRESQALDPQHRVLLEAAWIALEDAGIVPGRGEDRVAVFAGSALNTYLINNLLANPAVADVLGPYQLLQASDKDFLATRVAYKLGLRGPAVTVQSACSTSLSAVHLACQSLLNGECDIALAGGVTVGAPLLQGYQYEPGGIASPDGHCRPFDEEGAGTVPSNGVGAVVLRRLEDAEAAGDRIRAVVLGSAMNNDGSVKAGYTAPSVAGQAAVIAEALAVADVEPSSISYVEAHGTATSLGDPIEVAALREVFGDGGEGTRCGLGSVKGNIGHCDAASGIAGFIKVVLMLERATLVPSLGFVAPNPALELGSTPFDVVTDTRPWDTAAEHRRAGVSSFGIGGTNVHVVLEEPPVATPVPAAAGPVVLPLSGRSVRAVVDTAGRLADALEGDTTADLGAVAHTLLHRRAAHAQRAGVVARDREGAVRGLRALTAADVVTAAGRAPRVVFLFPGQGAQYPGMARELHETDSVFRSAFDECCALHLAHTGVQLRDIVLAEPGEEAAAVLARTEHTQPALFAVEWALARSWMSRGIEPAAMAGHSVGEYVAACLAGVLTLDDAVRLVADRGRLAQAMEPGSMLSIVLGEDEAACHLDERFDIAALNAPDLTVVSGPTEAIDELAATLADAGVAHQRLHTSHAFHSRSMQPAVEELRALLAGITLSPPRIPYCSNVTGRWITPEQATSPDYWAEHLRAPVRFGAAAELLLEDRGSVLLEVGPGTTLTTLSRRAQGWSDERVAVASLGSARRPGDAVATVLAAAGTLWAAGAEVAPHVLGVPDDAGFAALPAYPFARDRYWIEPSAPTASDRTERSDDRAVRTYVPSWRRTAMATGQATADDTAWLVLGGAASEDVVTEVAGSRVARIRPEGRDLAQWRETLSESVRELVQGAGELRVLHALGLEAAGSTPVEHLRHTEETSLRALLALAQVLVAARPGIPVHVDVLTTGAAEVLGGDGGRPDQALLSGLVAALPQEAEGVTARTLDLPADADPAQVAAVLRARPGDAARLALRGRHWWEHDVEEIDLAALPRLDRAAVADGGVYLLTGGFGGLAGAMAEQLARRAKAPVLGLLSRTPLPEESAWADALAAGGPGAAAFELVHRLRDLGAVVVPLVADVADLPSLRAAVESLRAEHGPVRGAIHAAGVAGGGLLAGQDEESLAAVLSPKTTGVLALEEVLRQDPLDFLLLCSSVTASLAAFGQSDYAAANAYLDAFGADRAAQGRPVVSVAWGRWSDVGMAGTAAGPSHPMLEAVPSLSGEVVYGTTFDTATSWVVDDHRLMGHGLVPGTAYLEIVRAALADRAAGRTLNLHDVLFIEPVIVPDGQQRSVWTSFEDRGERTYFTVRSRDAEGQVHEHATGSATWTETTTREPRPLDAVRAEFSAEHELQGEAEIFERAQIQRWTDGPLGFSVGPRWRVLKQVTLGEGHVLATLRLDEEFLDDVREYHLHPALMDMAVGIYRLEEEDPNFLPLSYGTLTYHAPLTPEIVVHAWPEPDAPAERGETLTCRLEILDPTGRVLVEVSGYSVKRVNDVEALMASITDAAEPREEEAEAQKESLLDRLTRAMPAETALAVMDQVLDSAGTGGHLIVSVGDLHDLQAVARAVTAESLSGSGSAGAGTTHPRPDLDTPFVEARDDLERSVAQVWSDVLGVAAIGMDDDFFALGGHSLAAVQIGTRVRHEVGVEFDLKEFYGTPTAGHLAALLRRGNSASEGTTILSADEDSQLSADLDAELAALSDAEVDDQLLALLEDEDDLGLTLGDR